MAHFRQLLITGAAGALGRQFRSHAAHLADRIVVSDRSPVTDVRPHEEERTADLGVTDEVRRVVAGCDAIVHLGGQALEADFATILNANIAGTYNIYEAARREGVRRIVYASSIHAIGYYERNQTVDASMPQRPDSLYGVSKAFGENLSRYYFDKFGLESVCIRIGSCFPEPSDERHLITWLSYSDFCQVVERSLTAPRVGHMIAMPTSDNSASFWDNRAASSLGFQPQDSADGYRDELLAKAGRLDPTNPAICFQGGSFCAAGHDEND